MNTVRYVRKGHLFCPFLEWNQHSPAVGFIRSQTKIRGTQWYFSGVLGFVVILVGTLGRERWRVMELYRYQYCRGGEASIYLFELPHIVLKNKNV
jgi:hypothetical protein